MPSGDRGRDRQAATPPSPAPPRPTHELGYRRRQARPGVGAPRSARVRGRRVREPRPLLPPCSIAFAIRFPVTCASRSRSPQAVAAAPRPRGLQLDPVRRCCRAATPRPSRTRAARGLSPRARATTRAAVRTASRSSSTSAARPSSRSIARSRAGRELTVAGAVVQAEPGSGQRSAELVAGSGDGLHARGERPPHAGDCESGGARRQPAADLDGDHQSMPPSTRR